MNLSGYLSARSLVNEWYMAETFANGDQAVHSRYLGHEYGSYTLCIISLETDGSKKNRNGILHTYCTVHRPLYSLNVGDFQQRIRTVP